MTEDIAQPEYRLWTAEGFREDDWRHAETGEALAANRRVILPLQAFLDLDPAQRTAARERIGVVLQPGEALDAIVPHLGELSLVALAFPAYSDGRSYSKAELLRRRHGFEGTVRATGDVLVDQLPHMLRTGFDQFEIVNPVLIRRLEGRITGGIDFYYQPTARPAPAPSEGHSYSWRRQKAG